MAVTVTSLTTAVCWRIWTERSPSWVLERVLAVPETMALVGDTLLQEFNGEVLEPLKLPSFEPADAQ